MSVLTPFKPGLFAGRGIIVTGGGTGLGFAIALVCMYLLSLMMFAPPALPPPPSLSSQPVFSPTHLPQI